MISYFNGVAQLRQTLKSQRVHGVILDGGKAQILYPILHMLDSIRATTRKELDILTEKLIKLLGAQFKQVAIMNLAYTKWCERIY